jgi:hypothetical protein
LTPTIGQRFVDNGRLRRHLDATITEALRRQQEEGRA